MSFRLRATLLLAAVFCPLPASAQTAAPEPEAVAPAHVAYVDGSVVLERDGRFESSPLNMPLLSGDRLKTIDGRAEVLFGDGSALHLDSGTTIDLQSDELVRLIDGRLRLNIAGGADARTRTARVAYRVDSPAGSIRLTLPGEYRIAILRRGDEAQLELAVLRGAGEIFTDQGTTTVRAGERAYASANLAPSYPYTYNSAAWDAFDRWSEARRDTRTGVSTQYLPSEVRGYASTFDEDGDWRYEQSYGYVWYPRVAVGWRPYYYGRWAQYPRFGWTWIGADRFAWPTHHYGRWGFSAGAWFWIPAGRWAPAYVSWAYAPGYVSWCPLGFDNRPVIAVNIFNVGPGYYSSSRAWTAVGYSYFGRDYVHRRAVDWDRFDRARRPSFQVAQAGPASRDVAVPRGAPIRSAGARSLPPSATPVSVPSRGERYINRGDEIVRSRTERPTPPPQRSTDNNTAVPRGSIAADRAPGIAGGRTIPAGPARRIDTPSPTGTGDAVARPRADDGTSPAYIPRSPYERGRPMTRPDAATPAYQPPTRTYQGYGERAVPRSSAESNPPTRESAPPSSPDSGPRAGMRPRGGYEPRPAPSSGGGERQAPSGSGARERPAPPPRSAAPADRSAPSRGVAVPRGRGGR